MAKKTRRTSEQVAQAVAEVDALTAGGTDQETAFKQVGLSETVYRRFKQKGKGGKRERVERGSVRADSIPPRPKKGAKRIKRPLNLADIGAVAHRISVLDRKLRIIDVLVRERIRLVGHLIVLLKDRKEK